MIAQEWPLILGIDAVAVGLIVGDKGFRADGNGIQLVEASFLARASSTTSQRSRCAPSGAAIRCSAPPAT